MAILSRGEAVGPSNPKLQFLAVTKGPEDFRAGRMTDVEFLEYQILDISTPAKQTSPVEVVARTAVNLTSDRLGRGRYAASYTVNANEAVGRHEVRWYYKVDAADAETLERATFDVVDSISPTADVPSYCTPADLKEEGVCGKTDAYLLQRIGLASRYIERVTGRFFVPRYLQFNADGSGSPYLLLEMPIIGIEQLLYETSPYLPSSEDIDDELIRVYSRHLSQGLTRPDDRDNPKVELFRFSDEIITGTPYALSGRLIFPLGQQNVVVKGVFGYTEPDGSMSGGTPHLIQHACKLLVMRELSELANLAARDDALKRYRIKSEKTRDQAYSLDGLASLGRVGAFTGDPDIDNILASFVRPPTARGV